MKNISINILIFIIGNMINKYKLFKYISNKKLYIIMFISTIVILVESTFYISELYFGNTVLAISLFTLCIKNPYILKVSILEKIGENYSLLIYILHPLLKDILNYTYKILELTKNNIVLYIKPIILIIFSVFISIIIKNVQKN